MTDGYSSVASIAIFSIPSVACTRFFLQTCFDDNAFLCPSPRRCCICLSRIVSDSDVCASVSVSCSRSCPLTSAKFCSCGVPPGSILDLLSFACLTHCIVARDRSCLCSRSDLLQDLRGFASMSTRSLMIHPSTAAVQPAPATVHSLAVLPAAVLFAPATTMLSPVSI